MVSLLGLTASAHSSTLILLATRAGMSAEH